MTQDKTIGFIGGGQMAEALVKGLLAKELFSRDRVAVSEPWDQRREYLRDTYGLEVYEENKDVAARAGILLLAVKPQVMALVLEDLAPAITPDHLVISIAAGVPLRALEGGLPSGTRVIRVMPNTPALIQEGAAALCKGSAATGEDMETAMSIFRAVGTACEVPEFMMDAVTGLSGSGPAYVYTFIDALINGGVKMGLPRPIAQELAVQTVIGAARMVTVTGRHPGDLTAMVTSPGGTTIAGLHALDKGALRAVVMDGVEQATLRSRELGGD